MPQATVQMDEPADAGDFVAEVVTAVHEPAGAETASVAGEYVPMVLFLAIAATFCVKYYFVHRSRQDVQATVRLALERGDPLTPEVLDRLVQAPTPQRTDLRRGVVGIGLGVGLGVFGLVLGQPDAVRPMLAVGMVPLLLGLAYLVLWRLNGDQR